MRLNILVNPVVAYTSIWLLTVFLVSLQLTTNLRPLNTSTLILVFSNIITFIIIYVIFTIQYPVKKSYFDKDIWFPELALLREYTGTILTLWIVGTVLEVIFSGGVPLLWIIMHVAKDYTNFGVPTFHGLMNALYLFCIMAIFLDYQVRKKRKSLILCLLLLSWQIIVIGRCTLFTAIAQMVCIYFFISKQKLNISFFLKGLLSLFMIIFLFGVIGDIRHSISPLPGLVADEYRYFFNNVISGFLWFYVYITSPLNNIIANIGNLMPHYTPYYSIVFFIPTVIRETLFAGHQLNPLSLVISHLNVSTFYSGFVADFGILGAIIIVAAIQLVVTIFYLQARNFQIWALLAYSTLFQCILSSIFFNLFFNWIYVFQIILAVLFKKLSERY